jgi:hypothetical protein
LRKQFVFGCFVGLELAEGWDWACLGLRAPKIGKPKLFNFTSLFLLRQYEGWCV